MSEKIPKLSQEEIDKIQGLSTVPSKKCSGMLCNNIGVCLGSSEVKGALEALDSDRMQPGVIKALGFMEKTGCDNLPEARKAALPLLKTDK